jgi:citronellol/citronellal dehydrogenase
MPGKISNGFIKNENRLFGGEEIVRASRRPEIMGDAAHPILTRPGRECTGNFFVDDAVLKAEGITDLSSYAVDSNADLMPDFFV